MENRKRKTENPDDLRLLLERFYQGETSLEEEGRLRDYFRGESIPAEMEDDRTLFQEMDKAGNLLEDPGDLHLRIMEKIDGKERKQGRSRRITLYAMTAAAAGLLLVLVFNTGYLRQPGTESEYLADTYEDPMAAYEEARHALAYVSGKFNKGAGEVQNAMDYSQSGSESLKALGKLKKGNDEIRVLNELYRTDRLKRDNN